MPAITARFTADISDFRAKLAQMKTETVSFGATTTAVSNQLKRFTQDFSGAKVIREADVMAKAIAGIGGASALTAKEQQRATATIEEAVRKYRLLGEEVPAHIQRLSGELQRLAYQHELTEQAAKALVDAEKKAADAAAAAHKKAADEAARATQQFSQNLRSVGAGLTSAGTVLTAAVSAPIIAGFGLSIKAAKDFESAYANVVKTVDGFDVDAFGTLNADAKAFSLEIRGLAKEIPVAATELAQIAAIGGQFGVSRQHLLDFTRVVAELGVAVDGISAEDAAAGLAQFANVAGVGEEKFGRLADVLVDLGSKGNSTEAQILEFAQRLVGAGTQAGLSAAEIFGLGATMANLGLNAEAGGTAMSKMLAEMSRAGAQGGAAAQQFATFAGKVDASVASGKAFAELYRRDAARALQLFFDGLSTAAASGQNLNLILDKLGIEEARMRDTTLRLAGAKGQLAEQMGIASEQFDKGGARSEEARKKFATFDNQLKLFKQKLNDVGIELGGPILDGLRSLLDASQPVIDAIGWLAKGFAQLPDEAQLAIAVVGGSAGLAPLMLVLAGQTINATASILDFVKAIKGLAAAEGAAAGVNGLAIAMRSVGAAFGVFAASLTGLYALKELSERFDGVAYALIGLNNPLSVGIANWGLYSRAVDEATERAEKAKPALDRLAGLRDKILGSRDLSTTFGPPSTNQGTTGRGDADAWIELTKAQEGAIKSMAATLSGADIEGKLKTLAAAWQSLTPQQRANEAAIKALVKEYGDLRQKAGLDGLPSVLEDVYRAHLPVIRATRELHDITGRYVTTALPDLSTRTLEVRNMLRGLTADGLIPTSRAFGDLFDQMQVAAPKSLGSIEREFLVVTEGTNDWTSALDDAARGFAQLGQIKPLEGPLADFAELVNLMNVGSQMAKGLASAFRAPRRNSNGEVITDDAGTVLYDNFSFDNFKGKNGTEAQVGAYMQIGQVALAASTGSTPVLRATEVKGRGNRALRGAVAGAAEGGQFGPYGALGGAVFGAIIGAAKNPAFEDIYHRVAKNFGVELRDETAKAIADLAKAKFGKDRGAAEVFSLDSIISDAGGLKDSNIGKMTDRLRDVFVMLETGKFTAEQATDALDRSFGAFAAHIQKSGSIASKAFQDVIALNARMGTDSAQIRQFVEGQTAVLGGGVANLAGPLLEQSNKIKGEIERATQDQKNAGADPQKYEAASNRLGDLLTQQKELAAGSAEEFERLGVIAVGAFNASVAAGTDLVTAVNALGPGLDTLLQLQKDLGIETQNAGLAELAQFRERVNANQELVVGAAALGETMRALASIGGLTNETLAAMEGQGVKTFERLVAAGFTENQALTQMKGFLLNVLEGHEQLGTPIDENTQRLVDQAREAGILKGKAKDSTQVMEEGFEKVVKALDRVATGLGITVPKAVDDASKSLDKLPRDIDIGVNVIYHDAGWNPRLQDVEAGGGLPGAAKGIYAWGPTPAMFGEGGQPELGGPVDFMGDVLSHAMKKANLTSLVNLDDLGRASYGSGAPIVVQVVTNLDGRQIARNQVRHIPGAMKEMGIR